MKDYTKHRLKWIIAYGLILTAFTVYVLLDTFVIPRSYAAVTDTESSTTVQTEETQNTSEIPTSEAETVETEQSDSEIPLESSAPTVTQTSYKSDAISIDITQYREYNTDIYVADVTLTECSSLWTALAKDTYGKNIIDTTSSIAAQHDAILAINGDYYGAHSGYVIRNGVLYREDSVGRNQEDLVISSDGSFSIISEGNVTAQQLLDDGAQQVLSFGPGLLENGEITVSKQEEVDKAKNSNPRTAIGMLAPLHYVFVVADGRTSQSDGLSLYQMASFLQTIGVQCAYNLDGGGSSTMVFNGTVINNPTSGGKKSGERAVSDIVCIR